MIERIFQFFASLLSDKTLQKRYVHAGSIFGYAVSYIYMGECVGFKKLLRRWTRWEKEYARRGYRTLPLDAFVDCGGRGTPLNGLGIRREADENPIFHAKIYRQRFLGRVKPAIDLARMMDTGEPQFAEHYPLPSTENFKDNS
ncbi:MAG: hypothetical protein AAB897_01130 [Patescibacteria group bacterium]